MTRSADGHDPLAANPVSPPPPGEGARAWYAEGLSDALGDRLLLFDTSGPGLELLRIAPTLAGLPGFETALRARVEALRDFTHPSFARVRAVTWLDEPQPQLALVSEIVPGERLSRVLRTARVAGRRPDPRAVLSLLRQLLPALAALHEHGGSAHGLLAADRIVVKPGGDLVITEHALGAAVDASAGADDGVRHRLGLAVGSSEAAARARHDITQVGRLAVAMLLGRTASAARSAEWADALDQAGRIWGPALTPPLRAWLSRALVLDAAPFGSAREAHAALEHQLPETAGAAAAFPAAPTASQPVGAPHAVSSAYSLPAPADVRSSPALPAAIPRDAQAPARDGAAIAAPQTPAGGGSQPVGPAAMPSIFAETLAGESPAPPTSRGSRRRTTLRLAAAGLAAVALVEIAVLMAVLTGGSRGAAAPASAAAMPVSSAIDPPAGARPALRRGSLLPAGRRRGGEAAAADTPAPDASSPSSVQARGDGQPAAAVIGWVNVAAPSRVRVYANGRLLGTTRASSFRLPPGDHQIAIVDEATGRRTGRSIRIVAGRTLRLSIDSFE